MGATSPPGRALAAALVFASASPSLAAQQPTAPGPSPSEGTQWSAGEYTWKLGGYLEVDKFHFDEIGSTDSFDPRTIPTTDENEPGDSTRIHAHQTRLDLDVTGPSSIGPFRAFVEGDFFGDQNGFRLRHGYGTIGPVLGGQAGSTFVDEAAMRDALDFQSPIAFPLIGQAQVRWTQPLPDVNARLHWTNSLGHAQLGLFGGMARFDPDVGSTDDVALRGVNLSTRVATFVADRAIAQVTYVAAARRPRGSGSSTCSGRVTRSAERTARRTSSRPRCASISEPYSHPP